MLNFELKSKLEECLSQRGFQYDFSIDDQHFFDNSYGKYTSITLRAITGLLNNSILNNDSENRSYDIDLINGLTKCLLESEESELKNVAWNSFIDCAYDKRFLLFDEMEKARKSYFKELETSLNTNHTPTFESERLFINPSTTEDGAKMFEYINSFDKNEYLFARMARNSHSEDYFLFALHSKITGEIIGDIGLAFDPNEEGTFHVSYYIKKEDRRKGYAKEAFMSLMSAIRKNEIILYGQWNKEYVLEEMKPGIKLLRIELGENNLASFHTAKSFGFDYEGKVIKPKSGENSGKYSFEHHFFKIIR